VDRILVDHLVRDGEQLVWNLKPERLCGLEVHDEVKLGRLLDRDIALASSPLHREWLAHRIVTEQADLPVQDFRQPQQHQDGGGFSGAVGTKQPENLSSSHRK
jgi:hypothetical protein